MSHKTILLLLAALCLATLTTTGVMQSKNANQERAGKKPQLDRRQFPVADYAADEQGDERERARRRARGKKYDKSLTPVATSDSDGQTTRTHGEAELLPAVPAAQSDAVVVGEVTGARAYLSNDKTGVYSEFTVRVEEVLKGGAASPLSRGGLIFVARGGGQVRLPSGRVHLYHIAGEHMPVVGRRYALFLKRADAEQSFDLLTGYEMSAGRVSPLDAPRQFAAYRDAEEATFLNVLREAIAKRPPDSPR